MDKTEKKPEEIVSNDNYTISAKKKFGQTHQWLTHQRTVREGRKDYECENCEKKFGHKTDLFRHQRTIHEGRKDYACDKCVKKFGHKTHLLVHQRTVHEGHKDYSCDNCEKKFGHKSHLLRHQKTVYEGRKDYTSDRRCGGRSAKQQQLQLQLQQPPLGPKKLTSDDRKKGPDTGSGGGGGGSKSDVFYTLAPIYHLSKICGLLPVKFKANKAGKYEGRLDVGEVAYGIVLVAALAAAQCYGLYRDLRNGWENSTRLSSETAITVTCSDVFAVISAAFVAILGSSYRWHHLQDALNKIVD
ncbi:unnamed protein product, partial [Trichogramma brassicae]